MDALGTLPRILFLGVARWHSGLVEPYGGSGQVAVAEGKEALGEWAASGSRGVLSHRLSAKGLRLCFSAWLMKLRRMRLLLRLPAMSY